MILQISNQAIRETSTTKRGMIGSLAMTPDGRKFRYGQNDGTAEVAALLYVNADVLANHQNRLVDAAAAVGDTQVVIATIGATAISADQYLDAYLETRDNAGEGYRYRISGHQTADASASDVRVWLAEPVKVALTTASEVSLQYSNYHVVQISVTDQLDSPAGVAQAVIPANGYGWYQTGGEATVQADEAYTRGSELTIGTGVAGQVEASDLIGEVTIGHAMEAGVDGEHTAAFLTID